MLRDLPVKKIPGSRYARILTYPILDEAKAEERAKELSATGVTSLRFTGNVFLDGIPVLGKGCVGVVTQAVLDDVPVALKIRRADADRPSMMNESQLLRLANSVDVGPHLITATRNFLVMELFDGVPLFRWAEGLPKQKVVMIVLDDLLNACFRLDAIGLDHGELSHAPKNVLVNTQREPCIVDFESASAVRRIANVTSLLQYFLFGQISKTIHASKLFPNKRAILKTLTRYKAESSVENFQEIVDVLGFA